MLSLLLARTTMAFQPCSFIRQAPVIQESFRLVTSCSSSDAVVPSNCGEDGSTVQAATPDPTTPILTRLPDDDSRYDPRVIYRIPIMVSEGVFAVEKPLNWTSSDIVVFVRKMLERDAKDRGAKVTPFGRKRRGQNGPKNNIKVGHGGTLDPLATGVLVIGVGKGTKELESYLRGPKVYRAGGEFGFETTTLDMEGEVTKTAASDHVTVEAIEAIIPQLTGTLQQIPPIFSAIKKKGKKLYQSAREGVSADDMVIEPREVVVHSLKLLDSSLPKFDIEVACGGGTYIRSIVRDIGYKVGSVATTTYLERSQQGQFKLEDCIAKDDLTAEAIYAAISKAQARLKSSK